MRSPYVVPMSALEPVRVETTEEGPGEPTGVVPEPVPATIHSGEGPFDPSLPINALGSGMCWAVP